MPVDEHSFLVAAHMRRILKARLHSEVALTSNAKLASSGCSRNTVGTVGPSSKQLLEWSDFPENGVRLQQR